MAKWFHFWDMHSGGGGKSLFDRYFIEANDRDGAEAFFSDLTGRDPHHVSCECCGADYEVNENDELAQVTGFQRGCNADANGYIEEPFVYSDGTNKKFYPLARYVETSGKTGEHLIVFIDKRSEAIQEFGRI